MKGVWGVHGVAAVFVGGVVEGGRVVAEGETRLRGRVWMSPEGVVG